MTELQLKEAAGLDIRYFTLAYKACPTCGRPFDDFHPMENLYPHWTAACDSHRTTEAPTVVPRKPLN